MSAQYAADIWAALTCLTDAPCRTVAIWSNRPELVDQGGAAAPDTRCADARLPLASGVFEFATNFRFAWRSEIGYKRPG